MRSDVVAVASIPTPIGDLHVDGWSVVWTVVVVLGTYVVARLSATAALRLAHRVQGVPDDLALQASRVVRYFVIVVGVGLELSVLGAPIQPVLVALLVVLAALVLMLRGIADNFGAGLVLQARHPLRLGDLVETHGFVGIVSDLNSRSVVIETRDGRTVHMPNHRLMDAPLVNHSSSGRRRSEVEVRVDTRVQVDVPGCLRELLASVPGVLSDPPPQVLVTTLEPARASLRLQVWHAPDVESQVCSLTVLAVQRGLLTNGVASTATWPPPGPDLTVREVPG